MKLTFSPLLAVLIIILAGCTSGQTVSIKDLRVEMKENPVGIGVSQPRFMWKISSGSPDLTQTSYQIQVAESPDNLKNGKELLWDSGEVKSDESYSSPTEAIRYNPENNIIGVLKPIRIKAQRTGVR